MPGAQDEAVAVGPGRASVGSWRRTRENRVTPRGASAMAVPLWPDFAAAGASIARADDLADRPPFEVACSREELRRPRLEPVATRPPNHGNRRVASGRDAADPAELRPDAGPDVRRQVDPGHDRVGHDARRAHGQPRRARSRAASSPRWPTRRWAPRAVTALAGRSASRRQHRDEGLVPALGAPGRPAHVHRAGPQGGLVVTFVEARIVDDEGRAGGHGALVLPGQGTALSRLEP